MLANAQRTLAASRAAGVTIIHSPIALQEGYCEITSHPYGILKGVVDTSSFIKGTWGCEIVGDVAPTDGDIVIEGKRGLDAFGASSQAEHDNAITYDYPMFCKPTTVDGCIAGLQGAMATADSSRGY